MRRREPLTGSALARFTRKLRFQTWLAQRASRRRPSWIDRTAIWILDRALSPRSPDDDFMRDELVDAGIGFRPEELAAYQTGSGPRAEGARARAETAGPRSL